MADYIKKIKTKTGDKQIDYTALANLPVSDKTLSKTGEFADAAETGKIKEKASQLEKEALNLKTETAKLKEDIVGLDSRKADAIVETASGTPLDITDSAKLPIQNLRIFGKSEQVQTTGKNLWSLGDVSFNAYKELSVNYSAGNYVLSFDVDTFASSTTVQVGINIDGTWKYQQISKSSRGIFKIASAAGVTAVRFYAGANPSYNVNARYYNIQIEKGTEVTGYEPYTGGKPSPSLDYPQEITIAGESGTIDLEIAGENVEPQTIIFTTPNGLMGIKVKSDGNYTDSTGQQWITDRVIEKDGVIGIERNIDKAIVDGTVINFSTNGSADFWNMPQRSMPGIKEINMSIMCQYLPQGIFSANQNYEFVWLSGANGRKYFGTIEKANEFLVQKNNEGNPLHIYYVKNPTFEPLPQSEQDAIRALHSNYPTTVVTNDADAPMELTYTADTKHYIDKKFEELNQAIVNTQIALL